MGVTRRGFLKSGGAIVVASTIEGISPKKAEANQRENRLKSATITTTICPYCAVGCGMLVHSRNNIVINIEGDPDHPGQNLCYQERKRPGGQPLRWDCQCRVGSP